MSSVTPVNPSASGALAALSQMLGSLQTVQIAQSQTLRSNEALIQKQGEAVAGLGKEILGLRTEMAKNAQDAKDRETTQKAQEAAMNTLLMTLQGLFTTAQTPQPPAPVVSIDAAEEADALCRAVERYPIRFSKDLSTAPDKQNWLVATEELILSLARKQMSKDVPLNTDCVAYWQNVGGLSQAQIQVLQNFSLSVRAFQNYYDLRKADPTYDAKGVLLQEVDALRIDRQVFEAFKKHYFQNAQVKDLYPLVKQASDAILKPKHCLFFLTINRPIQDMHYSSGTHYLALPQQTIWYPFLVAHQENSSLYLAELLDLGHFVLEAKFEDPRYLKVSCLFDEHNGTPPWLCQEETSTLTWEGYAAKDPRSEIGSPHVTIPKDPALDAKREKIRNLNPGKLRELRRLAKEELEQNPEFVKAAAPLVREYAYIEQLSNMLGFDKSWHERLKAIHTCNTEDLERHMLENTTNKWSLRQVKYMSPEPAKTSVLLKE